MIQFDFYKNGGAEIVLLHRDEDNDLPMVKHAKDCLDFQADLAEILYYPSLEGESAYLVGLGGKDELNLDDLRLVGYKLAMMLKKNKEKEASVQVPDFGYCQRKTSMAFIEGMKHADYRFSKKTDKKEDEVDLLIHYTPDHGPEAKHLEGLKRVEDQMAGVFLARDLVNETSNVIYPESLADRAVAALEEVGVKVSVLGQEEVEKMGMEAFLSVAKGSDKEAKLIVMEYSGDPDSDKLTGLVGKGLTYDSGGYSLKPSDSMSTMHSDMGGAGTVIGTMAALGRAKAKVNVVAVVAACENLVSGKSYKVGDIIGSLSGKTIEILNTDAEGRLTLADAIYYITKEKMVDRVIDLATLTGAALVALGEEYTACLTNDDGFYAELAEAAEAAGEKVWKLPNDKKFAKFNKKSKVADLINSPGRLAGTITAGLFVGEFLADEKTPWIHMDIAGTAYLSKENDYLPERATGVHVKTLFNLLNPLIGC